MEIFSKLDWFFKANRKDYIIGVLALMIVSFLNVLPSRIIGIVIDHIANATLTTQILLAWLGILLAIGLVQFALRYLWRVKIFGNSAKLQYILRQRLYNHFTHMDASFFQKYRTGDLMAHATNDLNNIRLVAGGGVLMVADIIAAGLTTIIAMIVVVDWRLTVMAIIPLLLLIVLARQLGKLINKRFKVSQEAFSDLNNRVQESIQGMKVIKSVGQEEADIDNFKDLSQQAALANREVKKVDASISPLITIITGVSYMIAILFGGRLVFVNEITIGDFVTFINYIGMMVWPMMAIGQLFNIVERGNASYDRVMGLMQEETSIIEAEDPIEKPISGDLNYDVDSFVYPDGQEGLKDIHFRLPEGETLGVVGRTGAGKTTLFKLLLRQYDHYDGVINYGGHDIRDYSLDALLTNIGYVPQDNFLFSDTVANNIRFSNPNLPMEEVVRAAKIAHIHEDIMGFEDGYEEVIGERGVQLSGGQKQRLTIARALITDPELLILDDSLSAVDAETEEAILNNLLDYRKGQTTIISAHRLSSVKGAGEILVMDDGEITERGTHEDLLAEGGWYQKIYQAQQLQETIEEEA